MEGVDGKRERLGERKIIIKNEKFREKLIRNEIGKTERQ